MPNCPARVHFSFLSLTSNICLAQDRLIYLDAAEDFVAKARRFYPPKDDDDDDEEENTSLINLPLLLSRMNQNISGGG